MTRRGMMRRRGRGRQRQDEEGETGDAHWDKLTLWTCLRAGLRRIPAPIQVGSCARCTEYDMDTSLRRAGEACGFWRDLARLKESFRGVVGRRHRRGRVTTAWHLVGLTGFGGTVLRTQRCSTRWHAVLCALP